eukprot:4549621-Pleurochrysis_carterae.AAC.1
MVARAGRSGLTLLSRSSSSTQTFHHNIRARLPTKVLSGPNGIGHGAPLRAANETLDYALLAASAVGPLAGLKNSDSSLYSPPLSDGQARVPSLSPSMTRTHVSTAALGLV